MRVRKVNLDASELLPRIDLDSDTGSEFCVLLADGVAYGWVTEGQLYEIAEAWRSAYDAVIEARHGVEAVI